MLHELISFHVIAYLAKLKKRVETPASDDTPPANQGMSNHLFRILYEFSDILIIDISAFATQNPEVSLPMTLCKKFQTSFFHIWTESPWC